MGAIALNTLLPLSGPVEPEKLVFFEGGKWKTDFDLSKESDKQLRLRETAQAIQTIALSWLAARSAPTPMPHWVASAYPSLVQREMDRHYPANERLSHERFTARFIFNFLMALQRQAQNTIGLWSHDESEIGADMRRQIDRITALDGDCLARADIELWGSRIFEIQSQIARWPDRFSTAEENLDFCPREVRSFNWLATTCSYVLGDYLKVRPDAQFDIYIDSLARGVTYRVDERFDLVGGLWAYGLVPAFAADAAGPPIVLIRGTEKNPLKEGFFGSWWLNTNPHFPAAAFYNQLEWGGDDNLLAWMGRVKRENGGKLLLAGHSLGGTICVALALQNPDLVAKAMVFNSQISKELALDLKGDLPEILQFNHCRDPICEMDSAFLGRVFHLDFLEEAPAPFPLLALFTKFAQDLAHSLAPPDRPLRKRLSQLGALANRAVVQLNRLIPLRMLASVEPLPSLSEKLRRWLHFADAILQYHSAPAALYRRCTVQRCDARDLGRTNHLSLFFKWFSLIFLHPLFKTILLLHRLLRSQLVTACWKSAWRVIEAYSNQLRQLRP